MGEGRYINMSKSEYCVKYFAVLLDDYIPGWYYKIDLNDINMGHDEKCILGQSTGDYWNTLDEIVKKYNLDKYHAEDYFDKNIYVPEWIDEINKRLAQTSSEPVTHFEQRFKNNIDEALEVYRSKSKEYGTGGNEFANIRQLAEINDRTPPEMCMTLTSKHFVNLLHKISSMSPSQRREKINDIHIYLEIADQLADIHND